MKKVIQLLIAVLLILSTITAVSQDNDKITSIDTSFNFITDTTFTKEEQLELTLSLVKLYGSKKKDKVKKYLLTALNIAKEINNIEKQKEIRIKLAQLSNIEFEYAEADKQYKDLLKILVRSGSKQEEADIIDLMASNYFDWSKYKEARDYYIRAKNLYEELGDKPGMARALTGLSSVASSFADYELALGQMQLARQIYTEINDTLSLMATSLGIGIIMEKWQRYDRAEAYYKQSLNHFIKTDNITQQTNLLLHLGDVYLKQGENIEALRYYKEAFNNNKRESHKKLESICYSNLGEVFHKMGNNDSALFYQKKALEIKYVINDRQRIAISLFNMAEIYYDLEQNAKSKQYLEECIFLARDMKLKELEMNSLYLMSEILNAEGNYKESNNLLKAYINLKAEIFNESSNKSLNEIEVRYESERIERENEILRQKDAINILNLEREQDNRLFAVLIIIFILTVSLITIFFINSRNNINKRNYSLLAKKNKEITIQKEKLSKLNNELFYSREQFRSIVENATIGIYRTHPDGRILFANSSLVEMLGYEKLEHLEDVSVTVSFERRERFKKALEKQSVIRGREDIWQRKDGSDMYVYESSWIVKDSEGNILHYEGIVEDISKRKEAERALQKSRFDLQVMNTSLQDKNKELEIAKNKAISANNIKSQFIANISHEIRTPLNSIVGFAEVLANETESPRHKSNIEAIKTSSNSLLSLINDILDMSKIQSGEIKLNNEAVDMHELVSNVRQVFSVKFREKKLTFKVIISDGFPSLILIDRLKLRQVLYNLISNAIKFTEKGAVSMSIGQEQVSKKQINMILNVTDTGIGIPYEEQESVFEAFKQGAVHFDHASGTGLGLSISKRLIEVMGGTIKVESEIGEGSKFIVILPKVRILEDSEKNIEYNLLSDNSDQLFVFHDEGLNFIEEFDVNESEIKLLKDELFNLWQEAYSCKIINTTLLFSNRLLNFAKENSMKSVVQFAEYLLFALQGFDVEKIDKLMELLSNKIFNPNNRTYYE